MDACLEHLFGWLNCRELLVCEYTCRHWHSMLEVRSDLWRRWLDTMFIQHSTNYMHARSKRVTTLLKWVAWKSIHVLPCSQLMCGGDLATTSGARARMLTSSCLGRQRILVGNKRLGAQLPMCWPTGDGHYRLDYYAYFKVSVGCSESPRLAVGVVSAGFFRTPKKRRLGHDRHSIVLDVASAAVKCDGATIACASFAKGDIIGCGLAGLARDAPVRGVFFTKNGKLLVEYSTGRPLFKSINVSKTAIYPVVGLDTHSPVHAHFISFPSAFDIFQQNRAIKEYLECSSGAYD